MIEAAWRAVKADPHWKKHFEELKRRMHPNQAIVTIAHHLLVVVWYVLTKHEPYRHYGSRLRYHYSPECIAYRVGAAHKYLTWSWSLDDEARLGLTHKQFAKYGLLRLGVQTDLTRFVRGKVARRIAPTDEVLARMAELGLSG